MKYEPDAHFVDRNLNKTNTAWKNFVGSLPLMLFLTVFALLLYHVIIVLHSIHLAYEPLLRGLEFHVHRSNSHSGSHAGTSPLSMRSRDSMALRRGRRRC